MMNRHKLNRKYSRLSTLNQLREERDKLDAQIELLELELRHDYSIFRHVFSFSYVLDLFSRRFSGVGSIVNGIVDGYYLVSSLFCKKRRCRR